MRTWLPFSGADLKCGRSQQPSSINKVWSRRYLSLRSPSSHLVETLAIPGHSELNRMLLLKLGIPETAIEMFGHANRSTWDEAAALRDWANQHGVSRIAIPTGIFSARRVRWIFNREFAASSVQFEILSFEGPGYTRAEWWKTEAGLIAFQNEIMKYLYYRFKY